VYEYVNIFVFSPSGLDKKILFCVAAMSVTLPIVVALNKYVIALVDGL